jgi:uncharacterized protein (DUF885 family)
MNQPALITVDRVPAVIAAGGEKAAYASSNSSRRRSGITRVAPMRAQQEFKVAEATVKFCGHEEQKTWRPR